MAQIGQLRHRLTILEPQTARDTSGGQAESAPETVARPWAKVEQLRGNERLALTSLTVSEVGDRITMRFRRDVFPSMRIIKHRTLYEILSVQPSNVKDYMQVDAVVRAQDMGGFAPHAFDNDAFDVGAGAGL